MFLHVRHVVAVVSFIALASIYSNQIILNFTFICMTDDLNNTIVVDGQVRQRYDYSTWEKSWLISVIAIGTMIATFHVSHLFAKYGARHLFLFFGLLSCVATLLIPWAAATNFWLLMFLRLLQGVAFASDFTTIGKLCVEWAPLSEISFFVGFLTVFNFFSSFITNPVTGWFCVTPGFGWQWSYYAHAVVGVVCFIVWWILYRDDPAEHFMMNGKELGLIHRNKSQQHIDTTKRDVPYKKILTDPTIIVCWISAFLDITSTVLLMNYAPLYFNKVLHFDVYTTGFLVSIMGFSQLPFKTIFCLTSDRLRCMSERRKLIFYNFSAFVICGTMYAAIAFAPLPEIAVVLFCLVTISSGANCGSFYKCVNFVARQHAHFAISAIQFCKCIALFAGPALVGLLVKTDDDKAGWNVIFIGFGILLILAHFAFWKVATDDPAEWTKEPVLKEGLSTQRSIESGED